MGDHTTALALAEGSHWGTLYKMIAAHPERAEECDDFGMMPLHWACTARDVQPRVIRRLVDAYPVAVMLKNKGGLIPLHIAIKAKVPVEVLQTLVVKNDESVCEETPAGETPVELAQLYALSGESIAYLSGVEEELRRAGRVPTRPIRFRPLSSSSSLRGFALDEVTNGPSESDTTRQDIRGLRERGLGVKSVLMAHALPPRWNLDKKCNICQLKFSYFKTRHHCRNCGVSVCSTHSSKRLPLQHIGLDAPQRVCILCYDDLRENGKPASAVVNLYAKKHDSQSDRRPLGDVSNNARGSWTTDSQARTFLESSVASQRSGYAFGEGGEFHDSDDDDDNGKGINPAASLPPRSRPRAQTEMEAAPERLSVMKDQVKELKTHMRELRHQKDRMQQAIEESNSKVQHAIKDKHRQEVAIAETRGESIIDVSRVTEDTDLEKKVLKISSSVDDAVLSNEELQMPDDATLDIAATCHYLGLAFLAQGDHASAIQEFRKSVSLFRRDADVWYNLARALTAVDEPYEAEIAVRRALELRPRNYSAMSLLGKILHARGDHDKSIEVFQHALGLMTTGSDSGDEEDVGAMTVGW